MKIRVNRAAKLAILKTLQNDYIDLQDVGGQNGATGWHGLKNEIELSTFKHLCYRSPDVAEYMVQLLSKWIESARNGIIGRDSDVDIIAAVRQMYALDMHTGEPDKASFEFWETVCNAVDAMPGKDREQRIMQYLKT